MSRYAERRHVVTDAAELPAALLERYQGLVDRLSLYLPLRPGERDGFWSEVIKGFRV